MEDAAQPDRCRWPRAAALLSALAAVAACGSAATTATAPAQTRCAMSAQADAASFPPEGGTGSLRITTSRECAWTAQSDAAWLVLTSPSSGQGEAQVQFKVASNDAPGTRSAAISINDQRQPISQQGHPCELRLSSELVTVDSSGAERTVLVDSSSAQCSWTATASVPWITILSGREGSGSGTVTFRVAAAVGPQRVGSLTIGGQTVRVEQGTGCVVSASPPSLAVDAAGAERVVHVEAASGCRWTASADVPWISILAGGEGSGHGIITFLVTEASGPPRVGSLTVGGRTVRVEQGSGCSVSGAPSSISIGAQGGTAAVQVQSGPGCSWTAAANQGWIGVTSGAQGSGAGRVDISVSPNSGPARAGAVTVGGLQFSISQASGCSYTIAPDGQSVAGGGTTGSISVATAPGCPWNAESDAAWITLSSSSGTGPGQAGFNVGPNASPARSGTIRIAGRAFTVNQASQCTYVLAPPFHEFDASGGNGNVLVIVSGPCTWTAASTAGWITMTAGLSGSGDGLVQFTVPANTGAERTGFVTIAGQQYRVIQRSR